MRYFIIFYNWSYNGETGQGNISQYGIKFPNSIQTKEFISSFIKESRHYSYSIPVRCVVVTNIIELDKEDYEEWFRE